MLQLAVPADREAVNILARQIHDMHVSWRPDIYEMVDELFPEERFLAAIQKRELYVAKTDGFVISFALLAVRETNMPGLVKRKVMVLDQLCVHEALRGQGIGTQMAAEIRSLAKAFGCTDIQLSVYPENDAAVAFYQKCGFLIRNINMQMSV